MLADDRQVKALIELFHQGTQFKYQKGEYIIRPGEVPNSVFYIEEGLVKAFDITKYGEENLLIVRKSHEIFPLIWALTGEERHVIYQAMGPVTVYRLDRNVYLSALAKDTNLLPPLLDIIVEQYKIHSERILNLEYRTVRERVISFLLTMSRRFGEKHEKGIAISIPLRHQDIASSVNASRETTSRELSRLERQGLIKNSQLTIILLDPDKLQSRLS